MAPRYFGPHYEAACQRCSRPTIVVAEAFDANLPARCFACGAVCEVNQQLKSGDTVNLTKVDLTEANQRGRLHRFDVVAFNVTPLDANLKGGHATQSTLKRVWAFPGEQIELRRGEGWINGRLLQKSLSELAEVCVPISCFPSDSISHWWLIDSTQNTARKAERIESRNSEDWNILQPSQQLQFRYERPSRDPVIAGLVPSSLVDDYPFNQSSTAELHRVHDFLVAIELMELPSTDWLVQLRLGRELYSVRFVSEQIDAPNRNVSASSAATLELRAARRVVVAICDERLLVATDIKEQVKSLGNLAPAEIDDVEQPLVTVSSNCSLTFKSIMVARDLWLGPRQNRSAVWKAAEDGDASGYFLLGDNLPHSIDSRDDAVDRIAAERIVGRIESEYDRDGEDWLSWLFSEKLKHY